MASTLTKEQFIQKSKDVHGSKYSYEKTIYVNMRKPITIICKKHGEFKQSPMNHLKTEGCPKCGYEGRHKKEAPKVEPKVDENDINFTEDSDEVIAMKIVDKYETKISSINNHVNPFTNLQSVIYKKPIPEVPVLATLHLTEEMLKNIKATDTVVYDDIDDNDLDNVINDLNGIKDNTVKLIKKVLTVNWDSIALNPTLPFVELIRNKENISIVNFIHSPAFLIYTSTNELSLASNILTMDEFKQITIQYPHIANSIKLSPDWFDVEEYTEYLYTYYVIPRMLNYGYRLDKNIISKFKARIIHFCIEYMATHTDIKSLHKTSTLLRALPEELFMVVYEGVGVCLMRHNYLTEYMKANYLHDSNLEKLITISTRDIMTLISETQVPSLKFVKKYRDSLDVILIMRSMIKNNRIFTSYVDEFIDDLMAYNKKRDEVLGDKVINFTGNTSESYVENSGILSMDSAGDFFTMPNNFINYVERSGASSRLFKYYQEDILKNIYAKTNSKLYKKLYESIRFDNGKNNEMIASIQSELETLLNNSKQLQEKLNKFKKSI